MSGDFRRSKGNVATTVVKSSHSDYSLRKANGFVYSGTGRPAALHSRGRHRRLHRQSNIVMIAARLRKLFWVTVMATAPVNGCSRPEVEADKCPIASCLYGSCSAPVPCATHRECPVGLSCSDGTCKVVPFTQIDRNALISGFQVSEFDIHASSTEPISFDWLAPRGSQRVVCALLTAAPEFSDTIEPSQTMIRLLNPGRAITRKRVFSTATAGNDRHFSFTLGDLEAGSSCDAPLSIPTDFSDAYPIVQFLRVGCWAIGDANVIAATRLVPIDPGSLPDWNTVPQPNCLGQSDRTWCRMPSALGSCQRHECDTDRPAMAVAAGGAGGQGTEVEAVLDCSDSPDDAPCAVQSPVVGQCLNGQCIAQDAQDYEPPLVVSSCTAPRTQGLNCFPSPLLDFGNCYQNACEARCDHRADCTAPFEQVGILTGKRTCHIENGAYLGSCRTQATELE
jgi:hypothetical protein